MTNIPDDPLDTLFRSLADPTRRAVVARLTKGPATVKELAGPFDMALPSFLQHLKVLESGGIVVSAKQGRTRTCQLNPAALDMAGRWLDQQRHVWEARLQRLDSFVTELNKEGENSK